MVVVAYISARMFTHSHNALSNGLITVVLLYPFLLIISGTHISMLAPKDANIKPTAVSTSPISFRKVISYPRRHLNTG